MVDRQPEAARAAVPQHGDGAKAYGKAPEPCPAFRRRRWILLAVAALLLASAAYLGLLALGGGAEGPSFPGAIEALIEPPVAAAVSSEAAGAALELVIVELAPRARLLDVPALPPVRLVDARGEVVAAEVSWRAGTASVPLPGRRPRGYQLLHAALPGGAEVWSIVHVAGDEQQVELQREGPLVFAGRVVDGAGEPVAGADVWVGGARASSAQDGTFRVDGVLSAGGVPAVIRASGKADLFRVLEPQRGGAVSVFALEPGVEVRLQCTRPIPEDGGALLFVRPPSGGAVGSTSLKHYPFFWPAIDPAAALPSPGGASLRGLPALPAGVPLDVGVYHPELRTRPCALEFGPRPSPAVVLGSDSRVVRGWVQGRDQAPIAGALVIARGQGEDGPALRDATVALLPDALLADVPHAWTDAGGAFALAAPLEPVLLSAHAAGRAGIEVLLPARAPLDRPLVLPAPPAVGAGPPALRLVPSRAVRIAVVRGNTRDAAVVAGPEHAFVLRLRERALIDVTVRARGKTRTWTGLAVTGTVDVAVEE